LRAVLLRLHAPVRRRFHLYGYTGHTEALEARVTAHRARTFSGYTAKRLPVLLIFAEEFSTRDDAFRAERMVKGWRRTKKLALARGDWQAVQALATIRAPERNLGAGGAHDRGGAPMTAAGPAQRWLRSPGGTRRASGGTTPRRVRAVRPPLMVRVPPSTGGQAPLADGT